METMLGSLLIWIMTAVVLPGPIVLSHACGPAEYEAGQEECCPMCASGYYVHKHCTEHISTTCAPCPLSTYTETPNGLTSCLSCTVCDTAEGLKVKRACSPTSDALCEPLEDHYCIDPTKDGCLGAVEHTKCSPGQYIKQQGTAYSDTVCDDCGTNTYSDGSFSSCKAHTPCESLAQDVIQEGTLSSNAECGRSVIIRVLILIVSTVMMAGVVMIMIILVCQRRRGERDMREGNSLPLTGLRVK